MNARLTFVHALSPLHAGIGQGIGVIDLPIAREKATGLPFLPGSSLKGTLRSLCKVDERNSIFGPETSEIDPDSNYASSVQFSDQRILLLPIRSLAGTFAWVTSPYVLRRLLRDVEDVQGKNLSYSIPTVPDVTKCLITGDSCKIIVETAARQVYLEDLNLQAEVDSNSAVSSWATWISQQVFPTDTSWKQMITERFCLVHDDVFNFLIDTATEITARVKLLEESKTVKSGGLWYEEALPTESILSGTILGTPTPASKLSIEQIFKVISDVTGKAVQLGGKATVGRGICRVLIGKEA